MPGGEGGAAQWRRGGTADPLRRCETGAVRPEVHPAPERRRRGPAHWSDTLLNLTRYRQDEVNTAQAEFADYMAAHVAAKRAGPGEDLLSELITATDPDGHRMSDAELVATGRALLVAGYETTANMIGKMMAMLLADRSHWERLLADRSLVRTAVEEALRFDAGAHSCLGQALARTE
ncbi:cytochrome P450, partial [Streptomyces albiflaviniger]|nr:cytochrome P450 [Streptomyces albiflaviniger]